jgi:hypothetical protein
MPRLATTALAVSAVLLAAAPVAAAKEITGMKICGREGCVALDRGVGQRFHNNGALYAGSLGRDPGRVRHYRLVMLFGDGNGGIAGRVSMAYSPRLRAVLDLGSDPSAGWSRIKDSAAARLDRRAAGLTPLPATRLTAGGGESAGVRPPEVWEPWREAEEADADAEGGLPRPLLAGVPAALLLGLVLVRFGRRREPS